MRSLLVLVLMGVSTSLSLAGDTLRDGNRWRKLGPSEREMKPATAALIDEFETAERAMVAELSFLEAQGATKGQRLLGDRSLARFRETREQIAGVLIDSAKIAPWNRRFNEVMYGRLAASDSLRLEALCDSLLFVERSLPLYCVRSALDSGSSIRPSPFNMGVVYIGVAGKRPDALRERYSAPRDRLFEAADVAKVYRFGARHAYAREFTTMMTRARMMEWMVEVPSLAGPVFPYAGLEGRREIKAVRLAVFGASRARPERGDVATDTLIFYWGILDPDVDEVVPDEQRDLPVFLGFDYVIAPAGPGVPARAYDDRPPARSVTNEKASVWRIALCAPFELVAKLVIGAKQTAGEATKAPFKFVEGAVRYGPSGAVAGVGDSIARVGATWSTLGRTWTARWPHESVCDIIAEVPIVGGIIPVVGEKSPVDSTARRHLYVTRGEGGGSSEEQFTGAWVQSMATVYARPTGLLDEPADVAAIPYQRATTCDTVWSWLNLSAAPGYEMSRDILFPDAFDRTPDARVGESVCLMGQGAGSRRASDAARVLRRAGLGDPLVVHVDKDGAAPATVDLSTGLLNWQATGEEARTVYLP